MAMNPIWTTRPIFVSSTFLDMQAERDHLRNVVFPELEERLRERCHYLEPVDLRFYDIAAKIKQDHDTGAIKHDHARELLVLKVCLREIYRSRPFLIAMIGDRYGEILPQDLVLAAAGEAGFSTDPCGKSITALELNYALSEHPGQCRRTHVYLRGPLPYERMGPVAAAYSHRHSGEPGATELADRVDAMKEVLERDPRLAGRVHRYSARWDEKASPPSVAGLDAWGREVVEHLWKDLEEETRAFIHPPPTTWDERERQALEEAIARHARTFVGLEKGRETLTRSLVDFALAPTPIGSDSAGGEVVWGRCLTGAAGAGKSALLAQVYRELTRPDSPVGGKVVVLAAAPGTGLQSALVDPMLRRWTIELARALDVTVPAGDDSSTESRFHELLAAASTGRRVVLIIDALDQFEPTIQAQHLTWLPQRWPANARLITAAIPGLQSKSLAGRSGVEVKELETMDSAEAREIVRAVYLRYHRPASDDIVAIVIDKKSEEGKLACGNPLWTQLAAEELNLLDAEDFVRVEQMQGVPHEERVRRLGLEIARELPPDVEQLYNRMLHRAAEMFGEPLTSAFVALMAAGRQGWRESDFRALLPVLSGEAWDSLKFACLRRIFRAHLVTRGGAGQWDFAHQQMRVVTAKRRFSGPPVAQPGPWIKELAAYTQKVQNSEVELRPGLPYKIVRQLHLAMRVPGVGNAPPTVDECIADHLERLPRADPFRQSEEPYHIVRTGDPARFVHYIESMSADDVDYAVAALADYVAADGHNPEQRNLQWVISTFDIARDPKKKFLLLSLVPRHMDDKLEGRVDLSVRFQLAKAAVDRLEGLRSEAPDDQEIARHAAIGISSLADLCRKRGEIEKAIAYQRRAQIITDALDSPQSAGALQLHAMIENRRMLAEQLAPNDVPAALELLEPTIVRARDACKQFPESKDLQWKLALCLTQYGNFLYAAEMAEEALGFVQEGLAIAGTAPAREQSAGFDALFLSASHLVLAIIHEKLGNVADARANLATAGRICDESLSRDPTDAKLRHQKARLLLHRRHIPEITGDPKRSIEDAKTALQIAEDLLAADSQNLEYSDLRSRAIATLREAHDGATFAAELRSEVEQRWQQYKAAPHQFTARRLVESLGLLGAQLVREEGGVSDKESSLSFRRVHNLILLWRERGESLGDDCDKMMSGIEEGYIAFGDSDLLNLDSLPFEQGGALMDVPKLSPPRRSDGAASSEQSLAGNGSTVRPSLRHRVEELRKAHIESPREEMRRTLEAFLEAQQKREKEALAERAKLEQGIRAWQTDKRPGYADVNARAVEAIRNGHLKSAENMLTGLLNSIDPSTLRERSSYIVVNQAICLFLQRRDKEALSLLRSRVSANNAGRRQLEAEYDKWSQTLTLVERALWKTIGVRIRSRGFAPLSLLKAD